MSKKKSKKQDVFIPVSFDEMVSHLSSKAEIILKNNYDPDDPIHRLIISGAKMDDLIDDE